MYIGCLMRNVQNLKIATVGYFRLDSPWCFSGCTSLTDLRLDISCTLKVPPGNCFPNLIWLHLSGGLHGHIDGGIKIMTTKVPGTHRVVLIFPVLVFLQLIYCEWLDVNSVEIQAPELLRFSSNCPRELKNYEIKICGPKLEVFELFGDGPVNNYVLSAPAVTYVAVSNMFANETSALHAHEILTKSSNLKCLRIHGSALKALLRLKPGLVFPAFGWLKELEIKYCCTIKDVLEFLQVLPRLESLIINVRTLDDSESGEALTPKIMSLSHLKEVKLLGFFATNVQHDLATCLLENAKNLKKMTVYLSNSKITDQDGKLIDIVEATGQSLSKMKPICPSCELVVERKGSSVAWVGSKPRVIRGNGNRYQIAYE